MVQLRTKPGEKILELGGGAMPVVRPNADVRQCYDPQGNPTVDVVCDFEKPLPFPTSEYDGVFSKFVVEHLSWRVLPAFLKEVARITKTGGKFVIVTANTEAQLKYVQANPSGWGGRGPFESASCILFGDLDYPENSHKNYLSPAILTGLLQDAGYERIVSQPFGDIQTDMLVEAIRSASPTVQPPELPVVAITTSQITSKGPELTTYNYDGPNTADLTSEARAALFDHAYFDGGRRYGGYREGYRDWPYHETTARQVLARKPESVLELGCGRGYVLKRIQDAGVSAYGIDISKHCEMTRASENIYLWDVCNTPWVKDEVYGGRSDKNFDLCFSQDFLTYVPEQHLPTILEEMRRTCRRGLHGIDVNARAEDDSLRCTLRPLAWWRELFDRHGLQNHELFNKADLEIGELPREVREGDGKVKLNLGSFTSMFLYGWVNCDVQELEGWAAPQGYRYRRLDVREGIPYGTGVVDAVFSSHMVEHLTTEEQVRLFRELRRAIRPEGVLRLSVPDTELLTAKYHNITNGESSLSELDHVNWGCAASTTAAGKLWALLFDGHRSCLDQETLCLLLTEAGWEARPSAFRQTAFPDRPMANQVRVECVENLPCLSAFVDAVPRLG